MGASTVLEHACGQYASGKEARLCAEVGGGSVVEGRGWR